MQGQCQICKGMFEIQPEWIGQQAECPHCKKNIVIQEVKFENTSQMNNQQNYIEQPIMNQYQTKPATTSNENMSTGAFVCGIYSLIIWDFFIPSSISFDSISFDTICWLKALFALLITSIGLCLGLKKKYKVGIILNIFGLLLAIHNAMSLINIK